MTGKFANALTPLILTILLAVQGFAQAAPPDQTPPAAAEQTPAAQTPTSQTPASGQETAEEESSSRRKRAHDYKNWNFNVGAGAHVDSGTTKSLVRGGGFVATIGVARNANKYFGLRGDFFYADMPLRDSTLQLAQATGATSYALNFTLDPIINIPVTKQYGGYVLFGPDFFHRSGSLNSDTTVPGSPCNAFWQWWGSCANASVPLSGNFNSNQNEFGYNFGAGVTRKVPSGVEIYAEYRFTHGSRNGITTDIRPITIGVRW